MKKERKEVKGNEVKELIKEVKLVVDYEYMCEEIKEKGVEKMDKGVEKMDKGVEKMDKGVEKMDKGVEKMDKGVEKMNKGVEKMDKGVEKMDKGVKEVIKEVKLVIDNEYMSEEIKEKGVKEMNKKEIKEYIKEIEAKRLLLVKKVVEWTESLKPVKNVNIKIKGRYNLLIEKESGKLFLIDKIEGKKLPFDTSLVDKGTKFVFVSILAEKKEEIEKEVEDGKRKYLEGKLQEINKLLDKF